MTLGMACTIYSKAPIDGSWIVIIPIWVTILSRSITPAIRPCPIHRHTQPTVSYITVAAFALFMAFTKYPFTSVRCLTRREILIIEFSMYEVSAVAGITLHQSGGGVTAAVGVAYTALALFI
ncbi:hypothetical protein FGO68_gene8705 [Halteria grandinella]|uniref:Uncharacterized protein n=1 Tax=Halteria grandinella TaxID=5974 RepID=A0A8J8SX19_HALGN|nr:hypothetical protein FGO68_gene8705 [Halteria grandinella]